MKIAVGFITYNTASAKYLPYFLDSLFVALTAYPFADRLVMAQDNSDNQANDNQRYIDEVFNKDKALVEFRWSGKNLGFGRAYNLMINRAFEFGADYFLIINPDTVIAPEAIKKLVEALEAEASLGSVAPKLLRWDFKNKVLTDTIDSAGLILKPGLRFVDLGQGQTDHHQFDDRSILGASGAAGLFKMAALQKIKNDGQYFDERFFMYKEDCDLAYRLFLAGYSSRNVSASIIHHDRSASADATGMRGIIKARAHKNRAIKSWSLFNQHLLFIKYWSRQSFTEKIKILLYVSLMFIFVLFREPYLLKNYSNLSKYIRKNK
jgi:GT2 family glycosyltransferase